MYSTSACSVLEEEMTQIDSKEHLAVEIYGQHSAAENAFNLLKKGNLNILETRDGMGESRFLWKCEVPSTTAPLTLYQGLIIGLDGPLHFRLFVQPAMALFLGIRDAIKDARQGRSAYFWTISTYFGHGLQYLRDGLKSVVNVVVVLAFALDFIYQHIAFYLE
jgi:hypothetical protein